MPPLLTVNAVLMCPHGGQVTLIPRQVQVLAQGAPILRLVDLVGAPIVGCLQPPTPATVPCTAIISPLPGSTSLTVTINGIPALVATATAITNGVPPGVVTVISPGQFAVEA
jgi:hypothetical protein